MLNKKVKTQLETQAGSVMFCLVREFLEFYDLDFTISVYERESYMGTAYDYEGRSKLINDLGIAQLNENPGLPLLLQIVQLAQLQSKPSQTKNININLSNIQNQNDMDENLTTINSIPDITHKENNVSITDSSDELKTESNIALDNSESVPKSILNKTFELNSPSVRLDITNKSVVLDKSKSSHATNLSLRPLDEKDDTYDGTSSLIDDQQLGDLDKSTQSSEKSLSLSESDFSPPIVKDPKAHSKFDAAHDKLKLSGQKAEKLKAKGSLSSLADLPPLQLNKSRNDTVLLPSLYSKEFKDKSNNHTLKELDKLFDVDTLDNYEEDFMSESDVNLNKSLDSIKNNYLDESFTFTDSNKNLSNITTRSSNSTRNVTQSKEKPPNREISEHNNEADGTKSIGADENIKEDNSNTVNESNSNNDSSTSN